MAGGRQASINRFEIWLVHLEPVIGSEISKTRPCVVISPDPQNRHLNTVIIAPMTSTRRGFPTRLATRFKDVDGELVFDQMRAVDKMRLVKRLGIIDERYHTPICNLLQELFKYD